MGQLEDLRAFVQIVEHESIGKAAEAAGIAKSAMSRRLRLLEERMQSVLIVRTTRRWALTEAGRQYHERGLGIVQAYDEFESDVRDEVREPKGEIRLSVPLYFGKATLTSPLLDFATRYPEVRLNIDFTDRMVDVIGEHYDLVVRVSSLADSSLIARKLCETRHVLCASPEHLASAPAIVTPEDLRSHRLLTYGPSRRFKWSFGDTGGKELSVSLTASMNSFDGGFLVDAAERALGVVRLPDFMVREPLAAGRLVRVLERYELEPRGVFVVYPTSRYLPQRTRALVDFLLAQVGDA